MPRMLSLFTGAGGLDIGLYQAGLQADVAVELEPVFVETLRRNVGAGVRVLEADVSALEPSDLGVTQGEGVDLMVGGPPCQSFSTGGGRAALSDPRGNLIFEYVKLIAAVRPRAFVLENVANLITAAVRHRPISMRPGKRWNLSYYSTERGNLQSDAPPLEPDEMSGSAVRYLMEVLQEKLGYAVAVGVLDAAAYGAPQHRLRFVLTGARDGKAPALPTPTHGPGTPRDYVTVRDVIWDLQSDPGPGARYTEPVRRVFDLVPEGKNWRALPEEVARAALGERSYAAGGGKTGFFRRLAWDAPSPTITGRANRKGSALCHPVASRPLSVRECARLQGFPDHWELVGSVASRYMQVGNAVPVVLGQAIGKMMVEYLGGSGEVETREVDRMLEDATSALRATARNKRSNRGALE